MRLRLLILVIGVCAVAFGRPAMAFEQTDATVRLGGGAATDDGAAFIGTTSGLPGWLRWTLTPQLQNGGVPGAVGLTDRSYRGVVWTVPLASGLLQNNDRLSFGFSLGNGFGDWLAGADGRDQHSPYPIPTTRLGAAIGYQVTQSLGLYVMFDHVSVSGVAREDEIANDLGIRLGLRF
jgi:lipid A 3-O-deacylase